MVRVDRKINELTALDTPVGDDLLVVYDVSNTEGLSTKKIRIDQLPSSGGGTTVVDLVIPIYANPSALPAVPNSIKFAYVQSNNSLYYGDTSAWVRLEEYQAPIDTISGQIEAPTNKTYILEQRAAYPYYVDGITVASGSGTAQVTLQINGVSISTLTNIPVTTASQRTSSPQAGLVPLAGKLTLIVSAASGILDLSFTLETSKAG